MAANVSKWLKYAQAKLDGLVSSGNAELDGLEAEQQAKAADKPWLASDGAAPTLDEARARIEWETEHQAEAAEAAAKPDQPAPAPAATPGAAAPAPSPEDAEVSEARLELERREREGKARLDAIRKELGVDAPPDPPKA
ncbi:hypothetical protein [Aquihabitans sp. McL0605]|uniref:hypothetical protein n=1 Tax=Aquihabitans sp. McL0605 TaxID=3415671 RepID=UPI003CEF0787